MATAVASVGGKLVPVQTLPRPRRRAASKPAKKKGGFKRPRALMARVNGTRVMKVSLALIAGRLLRSRLDIPWVSEEALGLVVMMLLSKQTGEKGVLLDIAIALQAVEVADRAGLVSMLTNFVDGGT